MSYGNNPPDPYWRNPMATNAIRPPVLPPPPGFDSPHPPPGHGKGQSPPRRRTERHGYPPPLNPSVPPPPALYSPPVLYSSAQKQMYLSPHPGTLPRLTVAQERPQTPTSTTPSSRSPLPRRNSHPPIQNPLHAQPRTSRRISLPRTAPYLSPAGPSAPTAQSGALSFPADTTRESPLFFFRAAETGAVAGS
jgi:hypothetical protein